MQKGLVGAFWSAMFVENSPMQKSTLFIFALLFVLNGCVSVWYGTLSSNLHVTPDQYNQIGQANGKAKTFILFGFIGGNEHSNLVNEAKGDLIRSHPLDSNMYFGDWSVSFQTKYHFLGVEQICRVNAGIFSLTKTSKRYEMPKEGVKNLEPKVNKEKGILAKGDPVEFFIEGERRQGEILNFEGNVLKIRYYEGKYGYLKIATRLISEVKRIQ